MDVSSNQTITGETIFTKNLQILNNLQVHDHLDGVDIDAFIKNVMTYNTTQNVTSTKSFSNLTTDSIWFNNCTDQQCTWLNILLKLKEESIHKTNGQISVNGSKSFSDVLIRGNLTFNGLLDGFEFPGDFLQRSSDEVINGSYTFNNVTFLRNITADTLNGHNLTELYERVLRKVGHEQLITGNWTFYDHTHFNKLQVDGLVDGVNLSRDALLANEDQEISGEKTFHNGIHASSLLVHNMTVSGLIDGVNLTQLNEELVKKLADDIIIKGKKIFENHVSFGGNLSVGLIDGVNISQLNDQAMKLDEDQVVTGKKVRLS